MEDSFELVKDVFRFMDEDIAYRYAISKVCERLSNVCDAYLNTLHNIRLEVPINNETEIDHITQLTDQLNKVKNYCNIGVQQ